MALNLASSSSCAPPSSCCLSSQRTYQIVGQTTRFQMYSGHFKMPMHLQPIHSIPENIVYSFRQHQRWIVLTHLNSKVDSHSGERCELDVFHRELG